MLEIATILAKIIRQVKRWYKKNYFKVIKKHFVGSLKDHAKQKNVALPK